MAKFVKGQSGNPKGRPKGSGWRQKMEQKKEHEALMRERLQSALELLDNWYAKRSNLLNQYVDGLGDFPFDPPGGD